jgi:hypothetical protein
MSAQNLQRFSITGFCWFSRHPPRRDVIENVADIAEGEDRNARTDHREAADPEEGQQQSACHAEPQAKFINRALIRTAPSRLSGMPCPCARGLRALAKLGSRSGSVSVTTHTLSLRAKSSTK